MMRKEKRRMIEVMYEDTKYTAIAWIGSKYYYKCLYAINLGRHAFLQSGRLLTYRNR